MNRAVWKELRNRYITGFSEDAQESASDSWLKTFFEDTLGIHLTYSVGSGRFGNIYKIPYTPALKDLLKSLTNRVTGVPLPSSGDVVLKFVKSDYGETQGEFVYRTTKENIMHRRVFQGSPSYGTDRYGITL